MGIYGWLSTEKETCMCKNCNDHSVSCSNTRHVRGRMLLYSACSGLQSLAGGFSHHHDYYCQKLALYVLSQGKLCEANRVPVMWQASALGTS